MRLLAVLIACAAGSLLSGAGIIDSGSMSRAVDYACPVYLITHVRIQDTAAVYPVETVLHQSQENLLRDGLVAKDTLLNWDSNWKLMRFI